MNLVQITQRSGSYNNSVTPECYTLLMMANKPETAGLHIFSLGSHTVFVHVYTVAYTLLLSLYLALDSMYIVYTRYIHVHDCTCMSIIV